MDNSILHNTGFDEYADAYDAALAQGLSVSGEITLHEALSRG
jgi:hypothetical protein